MNGKSTLFHLKEGVLLWGKSTLLHLKEGVFILVENQRCYIWRKEIDFGAMGGVDRGVHVVTLKEGDCHWCRGKSQRCYNEGRIVPLCVWGGGGGGDGVWRVNVVTFEGRRMPLVGAKESTLLRCYGDLKGH